MNNLKDIKVVYMGTPDFALEPLNVLIKNTNVVLVVTKPDAIVGRKKIKTSSSVKELALKENIPVFTPENIKEDYQVILDVKPDLIVTCAYGKIIPKELILLPKYGCVNIHASLLPKYRGAAPIQWALINGEKVTGVTLMYMDEFMDTGNIIDTVQYEIKDTDDVGVLHEVLSKLGSTLLEKNLAYLVSGNVKSIKQNNDEATYASMINREMEELNFDDYVINIYNKIRALSPWPLSKTNILGEEIKIIKAHYELTMSEVNKIYIDKKSLGIGAKDGIIYLDVIKPIGKKEMEIKNYLNGKKGSI